MRDPQVAVMVIQQNDIIDYFDNKDIACGVVLDVDDRKLRVLSQIGKEISVSQARVLTSGKHPLFAQDKSRDEQIRSLQKISSHREELKNLINLEELWEVVSGETKEIDPNDLAELCMGRDTGPDGPASLLRAIIDDKIFFKLRNAKIGIPAPEQVDQALRQREKERERAEFLAHCAEFLADLKDPKQPCAISPPQGLLQLLKQAAMQGADWVEMKIVKDLFARAGLPSPWDPFTVLVKMGIWDEDENLGLHMNQVSIEFSDHAEKHARLAVKKPFHDHFYDTSALHTITVDSVATMDIDDAISLSIEGDKIVLGIHITDVAHFVERDSPLDLEIRQRAISLYLPDLTIPMIPKVLSEGAASLVSGRSRPCISVMASFSRDFQLQEFQIVPGVINVEERLTYDEIDDRIRKGSLKEERMFRLANALRQRRIGNGAIIFKDPELAVHVHEDKTIEVTVRDREASSQILVSEFMILANSLFASFLLEKGIPALFRTQPPPTEKIQIGEEYDPVESYRSKKNLVKGDIITKGAPHATLGLQAYTTATSPLRRYADLVVQRQLRAGLGLPESPLDERELDRILGEISFRMDQASLMERERTRYFLLKYLTQKKHVDFEATVLHRFPRFYLVYIKELAHRAVLRTPPGVNLNPHDRAVVRVEKVAPREDKLILSLVDLLPEYYQTSRAGL